MKNFKTLAIWLTGAFMLLANISFSQEKTEEMFIYVEDSETFFISEGEEIFATFYLKNFGDAQSTKPYMEKVEKFTDAIKFSIKNFSSEEPSGQRKCFLRMNKENYLKTFAKIITLLEIKEVQVNDEFMDIAKFISLYK